LLHSAALRAETRRPISARKPPFRPLAARPLLARRITVRGPPAKASRAAQPAREPAPRLYLGSIEFTDRVPQAGGNADVTATHASGPRLPSWERRTPGSSHPRPAARMMTWPPGGEARRCRSALVTPAPVCRPERHHGRSALPGQISAWRRRVPGRRRHPAPRAPAAPARPGATAWRAWETGNPPCAGRPPALRESPR